MRPARFAGPAILALVTSACRYHGAVYSSYQQLGLDVRASTESNAPVKVSLSYERGVGAFVPKLDVDNSEGEAVSLLSSDDVYSTAGSPTGTQDWLGQPPLRASSAFISGPAAVVASAPAGTSVTVVSPSGVREVQTRGGPGARIATAFRPTARFGNLSEQELQRQLDALAQESAATQKRTFDRAAAALGTSFEQKYRSVAARSTPSVGFVAAKNEMLAANRGNDEPIVRRTLEALRTATE